MPKVGPIRSAILGLGQIAHEYACDRKRKGIVTHTQAYLSDPRFVLMGAYDPLIEKRQKFNYQWDVPVYDSIEALMMSAKPEVVSVCSPAGNHLDNIRRVLEFDSVKVIFCEKPLAATEKEAQQIKKILNTRPDVSLLVNFSRRYDHTYQRMATSFKQGCLGEAQMVNAFYSGSFASNASHMIDLINWFVGPLKKGSLIGRNKKQPHVLFYLKNRAPVIIQALQNECYHQFECHFFGTKKKVSFIENGFKVKTFEPSASPYFSGIKTLKKTKSLTLYKDVFENALELITQHARGKMKGHFLLDEAIENLKLVESLG